MSRITTGQLAELFAQENKGRLNGEDLQLFLENPQRWRAPTTVMHTVNYALWPQHVDPERYEYCTQDVESVHFPIRGKWEARLPFCFFTMGGRFTTQDVMNYALEHGMRMPDRAEVLSFLKGNQHAAAFHSLVGLCGETAGKKIGCIARTKNQTLEIYMPGLKKFVWGSDDRFLAIYV